MKEANPRLKEFATPAEPLCYAQIGGLTFATFVILLLVPVLYAIFVLDLKIVKWETKSEPGTAGH